MKFWYGLKPRLHSTSGRVGGWTSDSTLLRLDHLVLLLTRRRQRQGVNNVTEYRIAALQNLHMKDRSDFIIIHNVP